MLQSRSRRGFTLIEVMITVAIIAILSAIALPSYRDYVLRGKLVNATATLSAGRATLEQYFQDYRTYASTATTASPCPASPATTEWTISCAVDASTYTITATGIGQMDGFVFTIDQKGPATTKVPASWGTVPADTLCWVIRAGSTCS